MLKTSSVCQNTRRYCHGPLGKTFEFIRTNEIKNLINHSVAYARAKFYKNLTPIVRLALRKKTFTIDGMNFNYWISPYNATWANERAVEIPYIHNVSKDESHSNVLEVGNVMSNYMPSEWCVCDKYECGERVINEDVRDLSLKKKFNLIMSISTLEHAGFDEPDQDPNALATAIKQLKKHLAVGGEIHCTLSLGYNPHVDRQLKFNSAGFEKVSCLIRDGMTSWQQTELEEALGFTYGRPYNCANAVAFCVATK